MTRHDKPTGHAATDLTTAHHDAAPDETVMKGTLTDERRVLSDAKVPDEQRRAADEQRGEKVDEGHPPRAKPRDE